MAFTQRTAGAAVFSGQTTITFALHSAFTAVTEPSDTTVFVVKAVGVRVTGNYEAGAVSAFATTEPVSAITFKVGTAPAGAVTTSGGLFTSATVVQKIIAAGTVSNVET
jgi:hypothetical protein